jgi:hypothetical protein
MWQYAALAAPTIMSMLMPKPPMPNAPDYSSAINALNDPRMERYRYTMLNNAFNPNAELNRSAIASGENAMGRNLSRMGIGRSGVGALAYSQMLTDMQNKYLMNQTEREINAYRAGLAPAEALANMYAQNAQGQYKHASDAYNSRMTGQQQLIGGLSSAIGTGLSAYQYNNMADLLMAMRGQTNNSLAPSGSGQVYGNPYVSGTMNIAG